MKHLRQIVLILLIPALPAAATALLHPRSPWRVQTTNRVTVAEADHLTHVLWLDARAWEEYENNHIPGAMLLNEDEWDGQIEEILTAWLPEQTVIVYCDGRGCQASEAVAQRLADEAGIENVKVLEGGWPAWQKAHRP